MPTNPDIDRYLAAQEPDRQAALEHIRALVLKTVPDVNETMKYNMPTYERDEVVLSFASQKHYMSLYMDTEMVAKYSDELSHLNCGKSCIRFRKLEELPLDTIEQIIQDTVVKQSGLAGQSG